MKHEGRLNGRELAFFEDETDHSIEKMHSPLARPSVEESKFLKITASSGCMLSRKYHRCLGSYLT